MGIVKILIIHILHPGAPISSGYLDLLVMHVEQKERLWRLVGNIKAMKYVNTYLVCMEYLYKLKALFLIMKIYNLSRFCTIDIFKPYNILVFLNIVIIKMKMITNDTFRFLIEPFKSFEFPL